MLEEMSLTEIIEGEIKAASFARLTSAQKLRKLEELFRDIINKTFYSFSKKEREENVEKLKKLYVEIVAANPEDRDVKAEIRKREGLIDFSASPSLSFQTEERKEIEKIQNKKFKKYTGTVIKSRDNDDQRGERAFERELQGGLTVNGCKFASPTEVQNYATKEEYKALKEYPKFHTQAYLQKLNAPFTDIPGKTGFYPRLPDNYIANIDVDKTSARCITENNLVFFIKSGGNGKKAQYFSLPGHTHVVVELMPNDQEKVTTKFSNSVLRDLYERKVDFVSVEKDSEGKENAKIFKTLVQKAKREESTTSLYHWYKEQAEILQDTQFKSTLTASMVDYKQVTHDFLLEVHDFLKLHEELQNKFEKDTQFSNRLKAIETQLNETQFKLSPNELFIRANFGDGRGGDVKAEKRDPFNEDKLRKYLDSKKTPAEKLQALEEIFKYIRNNKNNLYTYTGVFKNDPNILTSTQKKHIGILKELYIEIARTHIKEDDVRRALSEKKGLVDFNRSNAPNKFKSKQTATRELLNEIVDKIMDKDDTKFENLEIQFSEVDKYVEENKEREKQHLEGKNNCLEAIGKIENETLRQILTKKIEGFAKDPFAKFPGEKNMKAFVNNVNATLEKGLDWKGYQEACVGSAHTTQEKPENSGALFITLMGKEENFPAEKYTNDKPEQIINVVTKAEYGMSC